MSQKAKREYLREIKSRYNKADKQQKNKILTEFCNVCGYNRKYAIYLLNQKQKKDNLVYKKPGSKT